jgi:hypothetical protein
LQTSFLVYQLHLINNFNRDNIMPIVGFNGPLEGFANNQGDQRQGNAAHQASLAAQRRQNTSFQGYSGRLGSSDSPNPPEESPRTTVPVPSQIQNTVRGQSGWSFDSTDVPAPPLPPPAENEAEMTFSRRLGYTPNANIRTYRQETRAYPAPRVREALIGDGDDEFWYTPAFEPVHRRLGIEEEDYIQQLESGHVIDASERRAAEWASTTAFEPVHRRLGTEEDDSQQRTGNLVHSASEEYTSEWGDEIGENRGEEIGDEGYVDEEEEEDLNKSADADTDEGQVNCLASGISRLSASDKDHKTLGVHQTKT